MVDIDPKEVQGSWDKGYVLDKHTISSTMIGYNEFGHPEFDTQRSPLGELIYRLKYGRDKTAIPSIVETIANFMKASAIRPDVIVPMPPSKARPDQPVHEISLELSKTLGVPLADKSISKTKSTPQMKDIGDQSARRAALQNAFTVNTDLEGKEVLLIDDLLQSGATMNVVAELLKKQGHAKAVYVIALTRTRN